MGFASENQSTGLRQAPASTVRRSFAEAFRFWEPRRLLYNLALAIVVLVWVLATWPHFRPMMTLQALLLLVVLGFIANVCYCAAYLVDIPLLSSPFGGGWKRRRWLLWLLGTALAIVLANYWIVDEIYPFVR
jgi:hypothetical protein